MADPCYGPCVEPGLPAEWQLVLGLAGLTAALFLILYHLEMARRALWRDFAAWIRDFRGRG